MRALWVLALLCYATWGAVAEDKPTSLTDAQAAVEANMKTPEGKAYDGQLGNDFLQKHLSEVRDCKGNAAGDFRSFWILFKLAKDGSSKEILLYPETKLGACARQSLLKDRFPSPPRADYWASIYFKISH